MRLQAHCIRDQNERRQLPKLRYHSDARVGDEQPVQASTRCPATTSYFTVGTNGEKKSAPSQLNPEKRSGKDSAKDGIRALPAQRPQPAQRSASQDAVKSPSLPSQSHIYAQHYAAKASKKPIP